jgi:hypothetical protein
MNLLLLLAAYASRRLISYQGIFGFPEVSVYCRYETNLSCLWPIRPGAPGVGAVEQQHWGATLLPSEQVLVPRSGNSAQKAACSSCSPCELVCQLSCCELFARESPDGPCPRAFIISRKHTSVSWTSASTHT